MTIKLQLNRGYVAIIDDIDADLAAFKWTVSISRQGLISVTRRIYDPVSPKMVVLHRIILERILERPLLKTDLCDHIFGDRLDNRRSMLRLAVGGENNHNSRLGSTNKSGYKGVYRHSKINKWVAQISVNNKSIYLGIFDTPEDAHKAYCEAAIRYYGDFANDGWKPLLKKGGS